MYDIEENLKTLKNWIGESSNIVFFGALVFQLKAAYQISAALMVYTTRHMTIRQKQY